MRRRRYLAPLAGAVALLVLLSGIAAATWNAPWSRGEDPVVAVVNGEPVDLRAWTAMWVQFRQMSGDMSFQDLPSAALIVPIEDTALDQDARRHGITVSDSEVRAAYERLRTGHGDSLGMSRLYWMARPRALRMSRPDFRRLVLWAIRSDLRQRKLLDQLASRVPPPSKARVESYVKRELLGGNELAVVWVSLDASRHPRQAYRELLAMRAGESPRGFVTSFIHYARDYLAHSPGARYHQRWFYYAYKRQVRQPFRPLAGSPVGTMRYVPRRGGGALIMVTAHSTNYHISMVQLRREAHRDLWHMDRLTYQRCYSDRVALQANVQLFPQALPSLVNARPVTVQSVKASFRQDCEAVRGGP